MLRLSFAILALLLSFATASQDSRADDVKSHPAMRKLPAASLQPMGQGPAYFVSAKTGDDANDGSEERPWKSINHAVRQLSPGDALYLRRGTYYEHVMVPVSGEEGKPITIRNYPGELVQIDGGLREFHDDPAGSWEPLKDGATGEYVSVKTYPQFSERPIVSTFPAAGWEPFYGKEDERPLVLGHFADSMVPLHGYRTLNDLRDDSMLWDVDNKFQADEGVYCGPGLWFNRKTERIHIRLAQTTLEGLGRNAYRGETDPRKLPLCISGPFGADVLRLNGVRHVTLHGLVFLGASGSPLINVYGSDNITLDHVTAYGGAPTLLAKACGEVKILHSAFRGLAAPWSSRASMKYRGTPSYTLITQRAAPLNHDWEIANCEFTDNHDGLWIRYVHDLKFHHNFVDNFNDDGLEFGARRADHKIAVYQNLISRCQIALTLHEMERGESPPEVDPGSGIYITRNVFDMRLGTFKGPPKEPDPTGAYLNGGSMIASDHGGPIWPNYLFYHNTVLRTDPSWRGYYGFGIGGRGTRGTTRRVFNNIFVQLQGVPGLNFGGQTEDVVVDGNLHWGVTDGPTFEGDFFQKQGRGMAFRKMPPPESWMRHDLFADPKFGELTTDPAAPFDIRLKAGSPAINAGVEIPGEWFDPLREADEGKPDLGAVPASLKEWRVGIDDMITVSWP